MSTARKEVARRPYKPRAPSIAAADFVRAWQGSTTLAEAATAIGLSGGAVRARANSLRKKGVPLKFLSVRHLDIAALSALARSLAPDADEEPEARPEPKASTVAARVAAGAALAGLSSGRRATIAARASGSGDFPRPVARRIEED